MRAISIWERTAQLLGAAALALSPLSLSAQCDLAAAHSSIMQIGDFTLSGGKACATLKNTSTSCTFPVAVETFSLDNRLEGLDHQTYLGSQTTSLAPNQTVTLCAPLGPCATQADVFVAASTDTTLPITTLSDSNITVDGKYFSSAMIGCFCALPPPTTSGCTVTQGFYKNHPSSICVSTMKLGSVTYTNAQLLQILQTPVSGNCLLDLAHQLITAQLNITCGGASAPLAVQQAISQANLLIGSHNLLDPTDTVSCSSNPLFGTTTNALDQFNNGLAGVNSCP